MTREVRPVGDGRAGEQALPHVNYYGCHILLRGSGRVSSDSPLSNLKMLMIQPSLEMGGAERQGLLLARWLRDNHGVNIEVWGMNHPGSVSSWCDQHEIPWRLVPWLWNGSRKEMLGGLLRLSLELRRFRPDVLLPYTLPPNVLCGMFWRLAGAKACIWNQRDLGVHRIHPAMERLAVRNTSFFVSNSGHGADFLAKAYGVRREQVEVVGNGIELPRPSLDRMAWRQRLGISPETIVVCMVANLHANKDHRTLLQAWRLVMEAGVRPVPVLLLAGHDYGTREQLKLMAAQTQIEEGVYFLGHVDDVPGLLHASDMGVFSSVSEGVPNGVLECMAAGLPVVATDIPGTHEALGADNRQLLTPPEDARSMAEAILRLTRDQALRQAAGQINLVRVQAEFSAARMCEHYCRIIARALDTGHRKRSGCS